MADITPIQTVTNAGLNPTFTAAAAGGDKFLNTGNEFVLLRSVNASPINVTIETIQTVDGLAVADRVVVVPGAGGSVAEIVVGKLSKTVYNIATAGADLGKAAMTYSTNTGLSVAVLRLA